MGKWSAEVRQQYEEQREAERKGLVCYLSDLAEMKDRGITVVRHWKSGKGKKDYTAGKRIPEYDLKNWKWVEVKNKARCFDCVISLNMPEIDPNSGNVHCLYDRIGIQVSFKTEKGFYRAEIFTGIDLPLKETDKGEIAKIIAKQFDFLCGQYESGGEATAPV